MKRNRHGFSIVEFMVGCVIILVLLFSASTMLKPLNQAMRKSRTLNTMIKVENMIRDGIYLQPSYTDRSNFQIMNDTVIIAKHQEIRCVSEDLSDSVIKSNTEDCKYPIQTRLEVGDMSSGQIGVVYQIKSVEPQLTLGALGVSPWPTDSGTTITAYLDANAIAASNGASATSITIPKRLADSTLKECPSGFMRGVSKDHNVICWNFSTNMTCPAWMIPVGYKMNDVTSSIDILCQKMNSVSCPPLSVSINDPSTKLDRVVNLANFYVLKQLALSDLYPPKANGAGGSSVCESVVDFSSYAPNDSTGTIPANVVTANAVSSLGAVCPDQNMYVKNPDGSCSPTFQLSAIPSRTPASVVSVSVSMTTASSSSSSSTSSASSAGTKK